MARRTRLALLLAGFCLAACGGSDSKYRIPVDSPEFKPFVAPEADEIGDDDDDWDDAEEATGEGEGDDNHSGAKPEGGATNVPGGKLEDGDPTATGTLAKAEIQTVIRKKLANIKHCYEKELVRDPTLAGKVNVSFMIKGDGSVTDVAASGLAVVDACVGKVIAELVFPKPTGGGTVRVRYPFVFTAGS